MNFSAGGDGREASWSAAALCHFSRSGRGSKRQRAGAAQNLAAIGMIAGKSHMNDDANNLLTDVLTEAATADFRAAMLGETLRLVRRRRRWRQARHAATLLAVLTLCGVFIRRDNLPQKPIASVPPPAPKTVRTSYTLVDTQPLPASDIVTTQPVASGQFITSTPSIEIVQTRGGNYRVINDGELLALVASHPAVLIRTGPHTEELVFANPKDQKGFPLN
ncbi:MAG TPA: hypothetical protein VG077_04800 [Verrucomicrobiae bacterium]|nr:hypothetical protein [Verrucomicrobiae bacterium]